MASTGSSVIPKAAQSRHRSRDSVRDRPVIRNRFIIMEQPKLYSKNKQMQTSDNIYVLKKYSKLIKWTNRGDTVLDVGCGEGYTTLNILLPEMPKNFKKLIGSDISEKMVKFAQSSCPNDPRINFCLMDIGGEIPEEEFCEEFDHVFSFYCLHWVSAQKQAFQNLYKLLKPGGDMLVSLVVTAPIFHVYENLAKNNRWASYFNKKIVSPYHHSENPAEEIRTILEEIGFENCYCIVEKRHFTFSNWKILKRSIIAVNPTIPLLPNTDKTTYIDDLMEEVRKIYGYNVEMIKTCNEREVPVEYKLLVAYASKPQNI